MVTYLFGPFRLVPDQRRLERNATPIPLTPKAFDLLVALVRHRERALSKDELLTLVWSGSVVEEGNLAQQVSLLRRRASNGSISVWYSSARIRRAKNNPPMMRLMPKHTPPCSPVAMLDR